MVFPPLKPFQKEALDSLSAFPHTLLTAATGSGKSLVFQKYLYDSRDRTRALIISPLNALSRQIASGLQEAGITVRLGVGRSGDLPPPGSGVWIVSPEKIQGSGMLRLRAWAPNFLVVDEAHCIWEWGRSFRPAFSKLPSLVSDLKIEKSFWCSATFPKESILQISEALPSPANRIGRFNLPSSLNLKRIETVSHRKLAYLRSIMEPLKPESGMIFVSSRSSAERLCLHLSQWGFDAVFYHAGLNVEERVNLERQLQNKHPSQSVWVVATSAFGMGMNYPFLKTCILFEPSLTLLSLAQALGRVGRSGASANAYVLWHENDFRGLETMMSPEGLEKNRLSEVKTWCATQACPREHLEKYFNAS